MLSNNDGDTRTNWDVVRRIDDICDAFESSIQRAENPKIEDFLDQTVTDVDTLLTELILLDLAYRRKAGAVPQLAEYASRFSQFPTVLDRLSDEFHANEPSGCRPPPVTDTMKSYTFIGAGSFGSVWKAWDTNLCRIVAVKTPLRPVPTPADRELIQREARVAAQLRHSNLVPVYNCGESEGRVYVVYAFVEGKTLQKLLKEERLSPVRAAEILEKVARAVHVAHEQKIVHRDLKPANLLIDEFDEPYVMDFGLAKVVDAASTIGTPDLPLGTAAYMSPEQSYGDRSTDRRSDVYSLGAILFEMLSGHPVFEGSVAEVLMKVRKDSPGPLPEQARCLEDLCRKCLEKDPADRFQTAEELADRLHDFITAGEVEVPRVSALRRLWKRIRRRHWTLAGTLICALALFAISRLPNRPNLPALPGHETPQIVQVQSSSSDAMGFIFACDTETGEPIMTRHAAQIYGSPCQVSLLPGLYQLQMARLEGEHFRRYVVYRTVPSPLSGLGSSRAAQWERWSLSRAGELIWPTVALPETALPEMALIRAGSVTVPGPDGPRRLDVGAFYVTTREFTFGDFLKLRPGYNGNIPDRPAPLQRPDHTMPAEFHWALHWAEIIGARLPTDAEFTRLAELAFEARSQRPSSAEDTSDFEIAGSSRSDMIPTRPPIHGILSGYPEWTLTWPNSPQATVALKSRVPTGSADRYRLIRGGTLDTVDNESARPILAADAGHVDKFYPNIGFRLVVSVPPEIEVPRE